MHTIQMKAALMGSWMLAIGTVGYVSGATSSTAWLALAILSLAAPTVLARLWTAPVPTMSESIRDVLR